ncbi:MAG: S41 family peptidase [Gemmatimonadota bacterium]
MLARPRSIPVPGLAAPLCGLLALVLVLGPASPADAQVDARLLRYPDVSATQIAFVYAGDIWVVEKEGGTAHRLATPPGQEAFPRFSPDGSRVAFTGNYDGNDDVYVVPTAGGEVTRVTHHPMTDRTLGWFPDGESVLYASSMHSGRQRFNQLYRTSADGGLPERLPVPYGEFAALSPDGRRIAYTPKTRAFRTWKRYRGGWAPDVWIFDLETLESRRITDDPANDDQPMWHEETVYFLSDRGSAQRHNIWAYDLDTDELRQVTRFTDHDVHFPSIGPSEMVFEAGGDLHLLDLETEEHRPLEVAVVTDGSTLRPRTERVGDQIAAATVSPDGSRAIFEARGELFSVPAEHGPVAELTGTSGVAERSPAWSPDGTEVAYWTDRDGEYQLAVRPAGGGEEEILTAFEDGFRYRPHWSPDGTKLAFVDQAMRIRIVERATGRVTDVDEGLWMYQGALAGFRASWSPDSRWLAYARGTENRKAAIFLYDAREGERHQVTSDFYSDALPVFGPDGDYLFFLTDQTLDATYGNFDNSWIYPNATTVAVVSLRDDVPSPLAPRDDTVSLDAGEDGEGASSDADEAQDATTDDPAPVEIDLEGFERRITTLPAEAGNYTDLHAAPGKVLYRRLPRTGSGGGDSPVVYWDLEAREEQTVLADADDVVLSRSGEKLLARRDGEFAVVDLQPDQDFGPAMRVSEMETTVRPREEWDQIFADVWRFNRDFFYDENMHGVDWEGVREQYAPLLEDAVTRWDVNFVLGEMIAELDASHTYRGGGDTEEEPQRSVGLLGVDWEVANGAYRIRRIVRAAPWDGSVRSPLDAPGVEVSEGDWVLAVNGRPLSVDRDPWAPFEGLAGRTVELLVNDAPTRQGARRVTVETMATETELRHLAWIQANRERVAEATDGRVGYVYVPSTGVDGQDALVRQFTAQIHRDGLVIDERWNSGGQIPDRFVELLNRPALSWWAVRDGKDWQWPPVAHFGPQVMLINGWSGSGGDAFPYYFRRAERGPLVGTRTWGGLIGISGVPPLVDGGSVSVPTFRMYSPEGDWFPEGHGVEPDIRVEADPTALAEGTDLQLERAIEEVVRRIEQQGDPTPERPAPEDRSRGGGGG